MFNGVPLPLNIPTPTPAPALLLGDARELGGHEGSFVHCPIRTCFYGGFNVCNASSKPRKDSNTTKYLLTSWI